MTEITWLTALLSPRSVSPHANFRSTDQVTPAGLLGLVVTADISDQKELASRLEHPLSDTEARLIEAAKASISLGTVTQGLDTLVEICSDDTGDDFGLRVAACLLASAVLSESDRPWHAVELLSRVMATAAVETDDDRILLAALAQQKAMRAYEAGERFESDRDEARDLIASVASGGLSRYPTSRGSRWPAATTNRHLVAALRDANQDLYDAAVGFPDTKTLQRWLKAPTSPLISAAISTGTNGSNKFVDERFAEFTMSSERSVRSQDPVDHPLWRSLMFFELVGHRRLVRTHRQRLGKLRMLRANGHVELCREGLRLLRQGEDAKALRLGLGLVRGGGPLAALAEEAKTIVAERLAPPLLREGELATLEAAAQLLNHEQAATALTHVLATLDQVPPASSFFQQAPAIRKEHLFKTAAALAPISNSVDELVETVLSSVRKIGPTNDQLLVRAHTRGLRSVDWDDVGQAAKERWAAWLHASDAPSLEGWSSMIDLVAPEFQDDTSAASARGSVPMSFDRIANELNAMMALNDAQPSYTGQLRASASDAVSRRLDEIRSQASKGMYSMYSTDAADLAVALIQHTNADLWASVTDFLLDEKLPRRMKAAALDRISGRPEVVPIATRQKLEGAAELLLAPRGFTSPFDAPDIDPFPPAVRALAALQVLTEAEVLSATAVLAAGSTTSKLEAARLLSTVVSTAAGVPQWAISIALQLSSDSSANVRAEVGRTLALAIHRSTFAIELLEERLLGLLAEDGILVPLLVLRGLSDGVEIDSQAIRDRIQDMAEHHLVFGVRVQAGLIADRLTAG